ncbi:glycoside hydrolase family 16 protein [Arcticibacterium luteifluviistationis]|uniref:Glycoside hydrolase n=1 Tax=Arcticibacterium luteifluviistationis TaxID=1784714 RepID=A0A2Z4GAA4_9BACT|nr:glycoside hydrolase family 16 protein [Arcticibacterium luteifluviistationis]AWV98137.1 glycoside hydrolase [Arcticibacterium luteifluviistationis]
MKKVPLLLLPIIAFTFTLCSTSSTPEPKRLVDLSETPELPTYGFKDDVSWSDEFDNDGKPDTNIWGYDLGGHGWGNNESQVYTDNLENAHVENGNLVIEAKYANSAYSSARLVTKNKKDFLYGRIEIKALLPVGRGTWPAIWTLATNSNYGENYWPDNGELDIMEHVGYDQNRVHANIHTKAFNHSIGTNKGNNKIVAKASEEYHTYRLDWYPNTIQFYIDNLLLFEFKKEAGYTWQEWPFDKPQHLLLNIAVGGDWGGQEGIDKEVFPQKMLIDYVRYYDLIEIK